MTPRCPDCDIEMLLTGEEFTCPLCGAQNVVSYYQAPVRHVAIDRQEWRDRLTEVAELLTHVVIENPEVRELLLPVYTGVLELAEKLDEQP